MTKKMKIRFLKTIIILIALIFSSCSSDGNSTENEENSPAETKQFIKTVQKQSPESWQKGSQFFYNNDKLEYVYLDNCSGELYYFEYNSDGKISSRYVGTITLTSDSFNPDSFDLVSFKQNSSKLNYVYQDKKLVKMQLDNGFTINEFTYNNDGTLKVAEWFIQGVGFGSKITFSYSQGKISKLNKREYDSDGITLTDNFDYTFEFDDKPNPLYVLVENFSLLGLYTCTGFDYISSEDNGYKLFKNNVTKVYRDEIELFSANYQYDTNNYPTRISYTNLNGNVSSVDLITY